MTTAGSTSIHSMSYRKSPATIVVPLPPIRTRTEPKEVSAYSRTTVWIVWIIPKLTLQITLSHVAAHVIL